jgi:hypothetical protein
MTHSGCSTLTFFSIPKPFKGHIGIIQRNALNSWLCLRPRPEIILVGDEEGTRDIARELGLLHISDVDRNENGTPLLSSAFATAKTQAASSTLCYVNTDIILLPEFTERVLHTRMRKFLMIGRRTNLAVNELIDFSDSNWHVRMRIRAKRDGRLHSHWGIDYFVFPRDLWPTVPPFAVGRLMWDNWLVYDARNRGIPVIDATATMVAIHQDHSYDSGIMLANGSWNWTQAEVQRNVVLAGGHERAYNVYDSNWVMTRWSPVPAIALPYLSQRADRLSGLTTTGRQMGRNLLHWYVEFRRHRACAAAVSERNL